MSGFFFRFASQRKWKLSKIDFKSAFLHNGSVQRYLNAIPPRELSEKSKIWLLLTASYGLLNSNAKWQAQSCELLKTSRLLQFSHMPQIFQKEHNGEVSLLIVKVKDDLFIDGSENLKRSFISFFDSNFTLWTIAHYPNTMRFYGLNITQYEDYVVHIDRNDKLDSLCSNPISRMEHRGLDSDLNKIYLSSIMSLYSSIGWLGLSASSFCSFYASELQQKMQIQKVKYLLFQINYVKKLQNLGSKTTFSRPLIPNNILPTVLIFSDVGIKIYHGKIAFLSGILFGDFKIYSLFHGLSWISQNSRRPF